jgi:hypothetical protein
MLFYQIGCVKQILEIFRIALGAAAGSVLMPLSMND